MRSSLGLLFSSDILVADERISESCDHQYHHRRFCRLSSDFRPFERSAKVFSFEVLISSERFSEFVGHHRIFVDSGGWQNSSLPTFILLPEDFLSPFFERANSLEKYLYSVPIAHERFSMSRDFLAVLTFFVPQLTYLSRIAENRSRLFDYPKEIFPLDDLSWCSKLPS